MAQMSIVLFTLVSFLLESRGYCQSSRPVDQPTTQSSSQFEKRLNDERSILASLDQELNQRDQNFEIDIQLREVEKSIQNQRRLIESLESEQRHQAQQGFNNYSTQDYQSQAGQLSMELNLTRLKKDISEKEHNLEKERNMLKDLIQSGISSVDLARTRSRVEHESSDLAILRAQYAEQELQYRIATSEAERRSRWQESIEIDMVTNRYKHQLNSAQNRLHELEKQYQELRRNEEQQRKVTADLAQKYREHLRNYEELKAQTEGT